MTQAHERRQGWGRPAAFEGHTPNNGGMTIVAHDGVTSTSCTTGSIRNTIETMMRLCHRHEGMDPVVDGRLGELWRKVNDLLNPGGRNLPW